MKDRFDKWNKWLDVINDEVTTLAINRHIFWEVRGWGVRGGSGLAMQHGYHASISCLGLCDWNMLLRYYLTSRSDGHQKIFLDDKDGQLFLGADGLGEIAEHLGVHYAAMSRRLRGSGERGEEKRNV